MAVRYAATKTVTLNGVTYNKNDLFPQTFTQERGGHPFNSGAWKSLAVPDESKADIYVGDVDNDTMAVDSDLLSARCAVEKKRLKAEIRAGYDDRMEELAMSTYPYAEQRSFSRKLKAAEEWDAIALDADKDSEIDSFNGDPVAYAGKYAILLGEAEIGSGSAAAKRTAVDNLASTILSNDAGFSRLIGILTSDRKAHVTIIDGIVDSESGLDQLIAYNITWSV